MEVGELKKVQAASAAEICRRFEPEEGTLALLAPETRPGELLGGLMETGQWADAIRFMAYALPKREAAWWACLAARSALGEPPKPSDLAALELAEKWVYQPNEEQRRATMPAAEATGYGTPAGWAAMAVFWSGGSIAPPDNPPVAPAPDLTAKAVVGAVLLAAAEGGEATQIQARYQTLLAQAIDIAQGGSGRVQASPPAAQAAGQGG